MFGNSRLRAKLWLPLVGLGLALLVPLSSASDPGEPAAASAPSAAGLVAGGAEPDLFLLHTGEVIGYLDTCGCKRNPAGGLARRAWVIDEIRRRFPHSPLLILDSGNFSENPTPDGEIKTRALLEGMQRMGYGIVNVGERDIRMGYAEFLRVTSPTPLRFLSCNLVRQDGERPVFAPRAAVDAVSPDGKKKVRVGVIGAARHNPMFLKPGPEESQLVTVDPIPRIQAEVEALRKEKVRLVVLLAALHKDDAKRIAEQVPGVDFILGSYGAQFTSAEERVNDTTVMYVGNQGKRVVEFRVFLDPKAGVVSRSTRVHTLTSLYPSEPNMDAFVKATAPAAPSAPGPSTE